MWLGKMNEQVQLAIYKTCLDSGFNGIAASSENIIQILDVRFTDSTYLPILLCSDHL